MDQVELPGKASPRIRPVFVTLDEVHANIPALLGMNVLDRKRLTPEIVFSRLSKLIFVKERNGECFYVDEWHILMSRSFCNHTFVAIQTAPDIYFALSQFC